MCSPKPVAFLHILITSATVGPKLKLTSRFRSDLRRAVAFYSFKLWCNSRCFHHIHSYVCRGPLPSTDDHLRAISSPQLTQRFMQNRSSVLWDMWFLTLPHTASSRPAATPPGPPRLLTASHQGWKPPPPKTPRSLDLISSTPAARSVQPPDMEPL